MDLDDRIALVTGAARRVGAEIALALARSGCHVGVHYRTSRSEAESLATRIRGLGRKAVTLEADLEHAEQIESLPTRLVDSLGGLDILVNSAAVFLPTRWGRSGPEEWLRCFRINTIAPVLLTQACQPVFQQRGAGCVVNVTDIYARRPLPSYAAYSASKAALESATKSLARLMAPTVRVNAVAPGVALFPESYGPEEREKALAKVPLERAGCPADVAGAVLFLVRGADYVTGETIFVDGGRSVAW